MNRWRFAISSLGAIALMAALPTAAHAQSAIGGTVKDASGAVLPGVTVEVTSDVLIEKTRSVSTDSQGEYRIVDLRPGIYLVTFSLQGFSVYKREGLELPSNFTATINAEMKVGALEESVTVSGASPVVDVQTNVKTQVLSRDVLDSVPSAKTIQSLGQLIVGVTLTSPDVGGSRAMQQTYFSVHGVGASGSMVTVDGLVTNGVMGDGAVMAYHNEAMIQEAVYQTAGGTAETITGGVNMNLVPKDGGNRFAGALKYAKSPKQWQGDNLTSRLEGLGVSATDKIDNFYEFNIEQGGPIAKDKLWFFGAFRRAHYDKPIANTFNVPSSAASIPAGFAQCLRQDHPVRSGHLGREDGQPGRAHDVADVVAQQVRGLHGSRDAAARPRDGQPHRSGDRHPWCGTRRPSPPARRSGRRPCRRSCCFETGLLVQPRALRQRLSGRHSTSRTARPRGTPARARATTAPVCCGTPRARSWATIRTSTT